MNEWTSALLELQELDLKIAACDETIAKAPARTAAAQAELAKCKGTLDKHKEELKSLEMQRKSLENENAKITEQKHNFQSKSALIKNNDEYRAALIQIEQCDKQVSENEDKILALMDQIEAMNAQMKTYIQDYEEAHQQIEDTCAKIEKENLQAATMRTQLLAQRPALEGALEPTLLMRYNRLRSAKNYPKTRPVVVGLDDDCCGRCHLAATRQMLTDVRKGKLVYCGSCGAIICDL